MTQLDDYYPFGMTRSGGFQRISNLKNDFLYNGKELQEETGWYDYGARHYDPQLGRFFTQDRFAEEYLNFSPYQYAANNTPLILVCNEDCRVR